MKKLAALILCIMQLSVYSQQRNDLQIIDVSQIQIRVMNACENMDSLTRSKIFADSIYKPYVEFWSGYVGEEADFVSWMNTDAMPALKLYNERNTAVDGAKLLKQFNEIKAGMKKLTDYSPAGTWYIVYGPGWTDLGSLSGGTMLIDLSHEHNSSNENIVSLFPHEITHQIMSNVNKNVDTTALGPIIGEGFAVYMNNLYWKEKFTLAQNLGYSENELKNCELQQEMVFRYFQQNKFSTDKKVIDSFRNRSTHIATDLPGAIGYYIGYRIVESYVSRHGKQSWKDVFIKSPGQIYAESGLN